jgi:hypothetical protein
MGLEEKLDWVDIHHPLIRNQAYNSVIEFPFWTAFGDTITLPERQHVLDSPAQARTPNSDL